LICNEKYAWQACQNKSGWLVLSFCGRKSSSYFVQFIYTNKKERKGKKEEKYKKEKNLVYKRKVA
jgi:hypothetical protein